jgi:hypothetical protein
MARFLETLVSYVDRAVTQIVLETSRGPIHTVLLGFSLQGFEITMLPWRVLREESDLSRKKVGS